MRRRRRRAGCQVSGGWGFPYGRPAGLAGAGRRGETGERQRRLGRGGFEVPRRSVGRITSVSTAPPEAGRRYASGARVSSVGPSSASPRPTKPHLGRHAHSYPAQFRSLSPPHHVVAPDALAAVELPGEERAVEAQLPELDGGAAQHLAGAAARVVVVLADPQLEPGAALVPVAVVGRRRRAARRRGPCPRRRAARPRSPRRRGSRRPPGGRRRRSASCRPRARRRASA